MLTTHSITLEEIMYLSQFCVNAEVEITAEVEPGEEATYSYPGTSPTCCNMETKVLTYSVHNEDGDKVKVDNEWHIAIIDALKYTVEQHVQDRFDEYAEEILEALHVDEIG